MVWLLPGMADRVRAVLAGDLSSGDRGQELARPAYPACR